MTNPQGNLNHITAGTEFMMDQLLQYLKEHPEVGILDYFMIGHNVHKQMVNHTASVIASTGENPNKVYREADMTFRKAMRELRQ